MDSASGENYLWTMLFFVDDFMQQLKPKSGVAFYSIIISHNLPIILDNRNWCIQYSWKIKVVMQVNIKSCVCKDQEA